MNFKTLFFVPLMLCFLQMQAQKSQSDKEFTVKFGYPYEIPRGYEDLGYFGDAETGFVQFSFRRKEDLVIHVFDKNLKVRNVTKVNILSFPSDFTSETIYRSGKKYFWLFSTFEKKGESETFWAQEIDIEDGKLISRARPILKNNKLEGDLTSTGFYQFAIQNKYSIYNSYDESKLLITYRLKHRLKNTSVNKEEVGFCILDDSLHVISNKIIEMPYPQAKMSIYDYTIDNSGNAYLLAKVYNEKRKEKKNDLPNYFYEIFRLAPGHEELNMIKLRLETYFIPDLFIFELSDNQIVVSGYYSKKANSESSDGVFLAKIDKDGNASIFGKGYYEFPVEVLKQFLSERKQKKMEKKDEKEDIEAKYLTLRSIVCTSDGGVQVFGEVYYVEIRRDSKGNERTTYFYEDILGISIDAGGNIQWINKIPKRQKGSGPSIYSSFRRASTGSMSFKTYYDGENTFLFYTDHINNLNLPVDQKPDYHLDGAGGFLVYAKIDKSGAVTKNSLFDYKKEEVYFNPVGLRELGNKTIVNRAFKGKLSRMVLLSQKE